MDGLAFAFAPGDGYVYSAPKMHAWRNLPAIAQRLFDGRDVGLVRSASFGPDLDSFFLCFETKAGSARLLWGTGIPATLKLWLEERENGKLLRNRHTKVTLGPGGSFFAWDNKTIRWAGIPAGLETTIQSWLGPSGWIVGPPRIIALGCDGSYFALSEYGSADWLIPSSFTTDQKQEWDNFKEDHSNPDSSFSFTRLSAVAFDSSKPGQYVYIKDDGEAYGDIPEPMDEFYAVTDTLLNNESRATRREKINRIKREVEEKAKAEQAKTFADATNNRAETLREVDATLKQSKEILERLLRPELSRQYTIWKTKFETDFNSFLIHGKQLTVFPSIPGSVCTCTIDSCKAYYKCDDGALMACHHDVEKLLRASGNYSVSWLKSERLTWHPNRFERKCDPDYRKALGRKAGDLFAIFQRLLEDLESSEKTAAR